MGHQIWRDWKDRDWEFKARHNPLFAVQTTDDLASSAASNFSPEALDSLFAKGRKLFRKNIAPLLDGYADPLLAEYGCGVGRILKAATEAGHRCIGIFWWEPAVAGHLRSRGYFGDDGNALPVIHVFDRFTRR